MIFNPNGKMPGVYSNEEGVAGPIMGVATSTAAFVGPAPEGPMLTPTKVTNWTEFKKRFGEGFQDRTVFAHYAVKGFFENGGSVCYFVRVGKAKKSYCEVKDKDGMLLFTMRARKEGAAGDGYLVDIKPENLLKSKVDVSAMLTSISEDKTSFTVSPEDIVKFAVGDIVAIYQEDVDTEKELEIQKIIDNKILLKNALEKEFDLSLGTTYVYLENLKGRSFCTLESVEKLEKGSFLSFKSGTQGDAETRRVYTVDTVKKLITFKTPLKNSVAITLDNQPEVCSNEFLMVIREPGSDPLSDPIDQGVFSVDESHSRCIYGSGNVLKSVTVERNPLNNTMFPKNLPAEATYTTANGADEFSSPLKAKDFVDGINKLKTVEDINLLCVPDCVNLRKDSGEIDLDGTVVVQKAMIAHCEEVMDRFAILDPVMGVKDDENMDYVEKVKAHKQAIGIGQGKGFGAFYSPWLIVAPLEEGENKLVPPSGHIAGVYARSDNSYGVHQAPAGEFLPFSMVLGVERELESAQHGQLNDEGVNVIRIIKGTGAVIWGARTITPKNKQWKYINVRRLMLYIEESIMESTRTLVFRPNNRSLWQTVKRQLSGFLTRTWQTGALVGDTADQAFRIKVDEELNPPETLADGMLFIEVKVYPTTPAEYIVFQIIQQPGGSWIKE